MRLNSATVWLLCVVSLTAQAQVSTFDECDDHAVSTDDFRCYGQIAGRTGAWETARERLLVRIETDPGNPRPHWALGFVEERHGRGSAGPAYEEAARLFAERGDAAGEAQVRLYLNEYHWNRGEREESLADLEQAVAAAQRSGDEQLAARVGTAEAVLLNRLGRYAEARRRLDEIEETIRSAPASWLRGSWLSALAFNLWAQDRFAEASDVLRESAALHHASENHFSEATDRLSLALIASRDQRPALIRQALEAARRGGNRVAEAQCRAALGNRDEDVERGREVMREASETLHDLGEHTEVSRTSFSLATNLLRRDPRDARMAEVWFDRALEAARRVGDYDQAARVVATRNHYRWVGHRRDPTDENRIRAIEDSFRTLDSIEAIRDLQLDSLARARSFSRWRTTYRRIAGEFLRSDPPDFDRALQVLERMRARVLLDELDSAGVATYEEGPLTHERSGVLRNVARVQSALSLTDLTEDRRRELLASLELLERHEVSTRTRLADADDRFAVARPASPVSLSVLQERIADGEALLAYQFAPDQTDVETFAGGSWVVVITRAAVDRVRLEAVDEIAAAAEVYLALIRSRRDPPTAASARLHAAVLEPALRSLPDSVHRLVIVPDGPLHDLPMADLRSNPGDLPLGLRYELSYAPSATLWARWRAEPRPEMLHPAVAFADPLWRPTGDVVPSSTRSRLGPLPHARQEGRRLIRRLGGGSRLFEGAEATEQTLKNLKLNEYGVVHLAAHALVDPGRPPRSGILLAPGGGEEDGLLQIDEIARLDLAGQLIVLSACSSAGGEVIAGEGVMHLGRGFFVAGAGAVVGSLWPIRDDEAAAFFDAFYAALATGDSVAGAVTEARRVRFEAAAPEAAWSGIVVLGDGSLVPFPGGRSGSRLPVVLVAAGALILATVLFRYFRG